MTLHSGLPALTPSEVKLLEYLAQITGCDVYAYGDAVDGRSLEQKGLAEIVKPKGPSEPAAEKQPYYGIMITGHGREWLSKSGLYHRNTGVGW